MARISIDNGAHFVEPDEAIKNVPWEVICNFMYSEIANEVSEELAPCSELEFLKRYLELSPDDLIIG